MGARRRRSAKGDERVPSEGGEIPIYEAPSIARCVSRFQTAVARTPPVSAFLGGFVRKSVRVVNYPFKIRGIEFSSKARPSHSS